MNLRDMLIQEEKLVQHAYKDNLGYWTIGYGRLIDERKGGKLSVAECGLLLDNDIAEKTRGTLDALPWFQRLNEPRQAVLIGMAFQMGVDGMLGFHNTLEAVRDERWQDASDGIKRSQWATQTPARAKRMANQMLTGEWDPYYR